MFGDVENFDVAEMIVVRLYLRRDSVIPLP